MNNTTEIIYKVHPSKNPLRKIFTKKDYYVRIKVGNKTFKTKKKAVKEIEKLLLKTKENLK
ncbi:MAG: hypothetical protein PUA67_07375 [Ruminococcus sp.]|nr:hypothetical protein [Ruminococcus sp.]